MMMLTMKRKKKNNAAAAVIIAFVVFLAVSSVNAENERLAPEMEELLRRDPTFVLGLLSKFRSSMIKPLEKTKAKRFQGLRGSSSPAVRLTDIAKTALRREGPQPQCRDCLGAKRGIDFGLGRGYSGNQAAKHFMGLVASNYAGGPGKRKRSSWHPANAYDIIHD